ncbi:MAG TPA: hypothetical protein VEZ19_06970 [Rubrobacter sp.]|nr:hypothetical protein [Rubrobacter sp.]
MTLIRRSQETRGSQQVGVLSTGGAAWLAWAVCTLVLVLIVCAVALSVPNRYGLWRVDFLIAVGSAALVGALVASRQPQNPVGWFSLGHALCFVLGEFGRQYAIYGTLTEPGALPFARAMIWPTYWVWYPGIFLMICLLPLYFPDGRLVSGRWRWVSGFAVVFCVGVTSLAMVRPGDDEAAGIPNPLGVEGLVEESGSLSTVFGILVPASWAILSIAAAASLVVRFWRSRGKERQQLKWFVYALVICVLVLAAGQAFLNGLLTTGMREIVFVVTLESLWVALAVAILRYRLYDIDLIINRTLVYGSLTATLALVYFGGVTLLQGVLRATTGQESTLAVVASTLAIAALFAPLRRRVQALVDRRFYRRKYDSAMTLEAFGSRLREETDLEALAGDLVGVASRTVQPEHVSLWLRPDTASGSRQTD